MPRQFRLSEQERRDAARKAVDAAFVYQEAKYEQRIEEVAALVRLLWNGGSASCDVIDSAPEHFFQPVYRLTFTTPDRYTVALPMHSARVAARPAWNPEDGTAHYNHNDPPPGFGSVLSDIALERRRLDSERTELARQIRTALQHFKFAKAAREALPELGPFLPPNYYNEVEPSRLPVPMFDSLRAVLASSGLEPEKIEAVS